MLAVSPQLPSFSRDLIKKYRLGFEILHDQENRVAGQYGLRFELPDYLRETYKGFGIDLETTNGDDSWTLPLPARYIIDRQGVIRYARVNADYTRRPEPDETIEALQRLDQ